MSVSDLSKSSSIFGTNSLTKCISTLSIRDEKPTGFHNLPTRVLLNIFSYFNEYELRKQIIPVCHKWRTVSSLPELWQELKFSKSSIPQEFICKQLRTLKFLKKVYFSNIDDIIPIIRQLCRCTPSLTHLTMKYCKSLESHYRISEKVLLNLVLSCRNLEFVNLRGTQFYGNTFYTELATLPNLKGVNISDNKYCSTKNLFQFVINCNKLEELKASHRNIRHSLFDDEATFLFTHLNYLKSLSFDMVGLTDSSLQSLILQCKQLEKLSLLNTMNISKDTLSQIGTLRNLKHLKICHSQIDEECSRSLFSENFLRQLTYLNLTGSWKLTTEVLDIITKCCTNLEKLILKSCRNLISIDPLLNSCKNLTLVNLAFCNKLSNNSLEHIPIFMCDIKSIYLDNSRYDIAENLKKDFPQLKMYICQSEYNKNITLL